MKHFKKSFFSINRNLVASRRCTLSFQLFFIGVILLYFDAFRTTVDMYGIMVPESARMVSILAGPFLMTLSAAAALREDQIIRLKHGYQRWLFSLALMLVFILVIGGVVFGNEANLVIVDLCLFPIIFGGILVGSKEQNWFLLDKLIISIFFVSLFFCFYGIGDLLEAARTTSRTDRYDIVRGFTEIYSPMMMLYFFWGTLGVWPYMVLTAKGKSILRQGGTFLGSMVYFLMAFIYQKRMPFASLMVFILLVFIKSGMREWFKKGMIALASGIIFWIAFGFVTGQETEQYLAKFGSRLNRYGTGFVDTLKNEDRISYDPKLVLTQLSGLEFLMGRGLGGVVRDDSGLYPNEMTPFLHNGVALIILKGGIVFLTIWMTGWLFVVKDFIVNRKTTLNRYYIPIIMVFSTSWMGVFLSRSVLFAFLMMFAGRVMSKDPYWVRSRADEFIKGRTRVAAYPKIP